MVPKDANCGQRGESILYPESKGSGAISKHLFKVVLVLMNSSVPKNVYYQILCFEISKI